MLIFNIYYLKKNDVDSFLELDRKVYSETYQVSKEATLERLEKNPETDIIVKKEKDVVGYISLCPVNKEMFEKIIKHTVSEEEIEKSILAYKKMGYYNAYLSSIVIDKERCPYLKGKLLFSKLQSHIKKMKKRGIFIRFIIALAVSKAGYKTLCRMGFREIRENVFIFDCIRNPNLFFEDVHVKVEDERDRVSNVLLKRWHLHSLIHELEINETYWDTDT